MVWPRPDFIGLGEDILGCRDIVKCPYSAAGICYGELGDAIYNRLVFASERRGIKEIIAAVIFPGSSHT